MMALTCASYADAGTHVLFYIITQKRMFGSYFRKKIYGNFMNFWNYMENQKK